MRHFIVRILKLLVKLGVLGQIVSFKYNGPGISLNKFYIQGHWTKRQGIKNELRSKFEVILKPAIGKIFFDKFYLLVFYNSKHDVDNIVGMEKVFTDTLKDLIVKNDSKTYYKGMLIMLDETLPKNTFEFVLIEAK